MRDSFIGNFVYYTIRWPYGSVVELTKVSMEGIPRCNMVHGLYASTTEKALSVRICEIQ